MRYLILSDPHANLQALEAVLADARSLGYDEVLVLGDLVGYGADPSAVIGRTLGLSPLAIVRGNHDKVTAGIEPAETFNNAARASVDWTRSVLSAGELDALAGLPQGPRTISDDIEICHGAPFDEDFYVFDASDASRALDAATRRICLFGHTHVPAGFTLESDTLQHGDGLADDELRLPREGPALINVGSVGQPRDGDPRAAYGLLDMDRGTIRLRRVSYDVAAAQAGILDAGLPPWLALRLERGH